MAPVRVKIACTLIWVSVGLGILTVVLFKETQPRRNEDWAIFLGTSAGIAIIAAFILRGHNWARLTNLILFTIGIFFLPDLERAFRYVPVAAMIFCTRIGLNVISLFLLFTGESRFWFVNKAEPHELEDFDVDS